MTSVTSPASTVRAQPITRHLTAEQVSFYHEHGWLRIPQVFTATEMAALDHDLERLIERWASAEQGWTGPWRAVYMDADTEKRSKLVAMHDLGLYSQAWAEACQQHRLCDAMADLLGPNVELHHSTLHAKPPETGHPFPMHQDWAFYQHADGRYVDALVHLDDTSDRNGEIRFLDGSHRLGALEHVTSFPDGTPCSPHLPTGLWRLEDTVAVPAKRGDVVVFNIHTIHGSYVNRSDRVRRLVRIGYRDPDNAQSGGQSLGRMGPMVRGLRSGARFGTIEQGEE